jgi:hypothetical protein
MGEFVGLATGRPLLAVVLMLVTALSGVVRGWITHRTTIRHEIEATRRVLLAVDDTNSTERAAVVRACAELEAASHLVARSRRPRVNRQCPINLAATSGQGMTSRRVPQRVTTRQPVDEPGVGSVRS